MMPCEDDLIDDRDLDLLVDGELDETARRDLLARCEASPDGWRRCAVAFLEAQAFRGAISSAARDVNSAPPAVKTSAAPRIGSWMARAAVILLAIGLGWAVRGARPGPSTERVVVMPAPISPPWPSPLRPTPVIAGLRPDRPAPIDYVRGRLEREGYRLQQRLLLVPAATRDGRRVAVPVEQVKLRFVGNRTV